jgi:hypothetical protein
MNLAAFQLRGVPGRSDNSSVCCAKLIDDAGDQRHFGSNDGQVGVDRICRSQVVCRRQKLTELGDPGVARRAKYLVIFLRQAPRNGMFAAAASDDEYLHGELPVYRGKLE